MIIQSNVSAKLLFHRKPQKAKRYRHSSSKMKVSEPREASARFIRVAFWARNLPQFVLRSAGILGALYLQVDKSARKTHHWVISRLFWFEAQNHSHSLYIRRNRLKLQNPPSFLPSSSCASLSFVWPFAEFQIFLLTVQHAEAEPFDEVSTERIGQIRTPFHSVTCYRIKERTLWGRIHPVMKLHQTAPQVYQK